MVKIAFFITAAKHISNIKLLEPYFLKNVIIQIYSDVNNLEETKSYELIDVYSPDIIVFFMAYPKKSVLDLQLYCLEKNIPNCAIQEVHQMSFTQKRVNHYFTPLDCIIAASNTEKEHLLSHHIYTENIVVGGWPFFEAAQKFNKKNTTLKKAVLFLSPLKDIDIVSIETIELRNSMIMKTIAMLDKNWELIIRLHPMEKVALIDTRLFEDKGIYFKVSENSESIAELIQEAEMCFNYGNSQVCMEVLEVGKPLFVLNKDNNYLPLIPPVEIKYIDQFLDWYDLAENQDKVKDFLIKNIQEKQKSLSKIAALIERKSYNRNKDMYALSLALFYMAINDRYKATYVIKKFYKSEVIKSIVLCFLYCKLYILYLVLKNRFKNETQVIWLLGLIYKKSLWTTFRNVEMPPSEYIPYFWRLNKGQNIMFKKKIKSSLRLLNKTLRPIEEFKTILKKSHQVEFLVFPVTYRCDLQCLMCTCPDQAKVIGELSLEEIEQVLKKLTDNGKHSIKHINLTGGEISLRHDLESVVKTLVQYGVEYIDVSSNLFSQRHAIDHFINLVKLYPNIKWSLQTSLDGNEAVHNRVRGNKHAFQNTIQSLLELKKEQINHNFGLSVNATVSPENIDLIDEVETVVMQLGLRMNYTYAVDSDLYINSKESKAFDEMSTECFKEKLINFTSQEYKNKHDLFSLDVFLMLHGFKRFFECAFYYGGYFLEPSGKLFKCSITQNSYMGNALSEKSFIDTGEVLHSIESECEHCFNNCGNSFYSKGYIDLYKSEFIQSRDKIYLDTHAADLFTKINLKKCGIHTLKYRGELLLDNELVLYTKYAKLNKEESLMKAIPIPIGAL